MRLAIICLMCMGSVLFGEPSYTLCIDGGGSKTALQVLDETGRSVPLYTNIDSSVEEVRTTCSNINTIGVEGLRTVLKKLFADVRLQKTGRPLLDLLPNCQIIAGLAGAKPPASKAAIGSVFEELGGSADHICVLSDIEVALASFDANGAIMIAGTGSICMGKKDGTFCRVGGLGRVLGDEGSGYEIGLHAIRDAVAHEYGWGKPTALTELLKKSFGVQELQTIVPKINRGEITPGTIAGCAPLVFQQAHEHDAVAVELIDGAARNLGFLLGTLLKNSSLSNCEVHLLGGLFKSPYADEFIQKILTSTIDVVGEDRHITIVNDAYKNVAVEYARRQIVSAQKVE